MLQVSGNGCQGKDDFKSVRSQKPLFCPAPRGYSGKAAKLLNSLWDKHNSSVVLAKGDFISSPLPGFFMQVINHLTFCRLYCIFLIL
jgi:hypothetical protein